MSKLDSFHPLTYLLILVMFFITFLFIFKIPSDTIHCGNCKRVMFEVDSTNYKKLKADTFICNRCSEIIFEKRMEMMKRIMKINSFRF